jgi:hypothetical protein
MADYIEQTEQASSGHKLGQLVGDWFQDYFVLPLLQELASHLGLYLDHRLKSRTVRSEKIEWSDEDGNSVDYDFVLELNGSDDTRGIPVAFFESFWRRGSRHSKDKARDDSGKLIPMRHTYPTARFLGIIASGDFTAPARDLIKSREIDLLYIPKQKIIECFQMLNLVMDYDDKSSEGYKAQIAQQFEAGLTQKAKAEASRFLRELLTHHVIQGYIDRVRASLSALPLEIRIRGERRSKPEVFASVDAATEFLKHDSLRFNYSDAEELLAYDAVYSDGFEFARDSLTLESLRKLNSEIKRLDDHMRLLSRRPSSFLPTSGTQG